MFRSRACAQALLQPRTLVLYEATSLAHIVLDLATTPVVIFRSHRRTGSLPRPLLFSVRRSWLED